MASYIVVQKCKLRWIMSVPFRNNRVLAMAFYSWESNPLWGQYVAQAVDASLGMEYPMIAFCGGRPNPDAAARRCGSPE